MMQIRERVAWGLVIAAVLVAFVAVEAAIRESQTDGNCWEVDDNVMGYGRPVQVLFLVESDVFGTRRVLVFEPDPIGIYELVGTRLAATRQGREE